MKTSPRNYLLMVAGVALAAAALAVYLQPAQAQRGMGPGMAAMAGGPRYTVVYTEGHNLIVTDNHANTLFFYTIDKDKPIGSELKLRGTVDLTQVGKPEIKPVTVNIEKPQS